MLTDTAGSAGAVSTPSDDAELKNAIAGIAARFSEQIDRSLFAPGEVFTAASPESTAQLYTSAPDFEALNKMASDMAETRRKLGVATDGAIYYRVLEFAPKVDPLTGEPTFYFLNTHGYWIIHPDNLPLLRRLVEAMGFPLLPLAREMECAPGWKVPEPFKSPSLPTTELECLGLLLLDNADA